MAVKGIFSYWWLPIISGLVWLGMLLGMLLHWIVDDNEARYPSMDADQTIAYISDIGAGTLKPLFIAGSVVTTVFLDLSFLAERWLRHRGRLVPNGSIAEKVLSVLSIIFAIAGTAGLILLSCFDTRHYPRLHDGFLLLFIGGYLISAICICAEAQRLGIKNRAHRVLRISFWAKLAFILIEIGLAIPFAVLTFTDHKNPAAVLEWVIALVFTFYVFSFIIDLAPAIRTKAPGDRFSKHAEGAGGRMEDGAIGSDDSLQNRHAAAVEGSRNGSTTGGYAFKKKLAGYGTFRQRSVQKTRMLSSERVLLVILSV